MATRFRLTADDRARLGGPEWYEYGETKFMLSEAKALQDYTGLSIADLPAAAERGEITALAFIIWMLRKRAGIVESYSELDFDLAGLEVIDESAEGAAPGNRAARRAATKATKTAAPKARATKATGGRAAPSRTK